MRSATDILSFSGARVGRTRSPLKQKFQSQLDGARAADLFDVALRVRHRLPLLSWFLL